MARFEAALAGLSIQDIQRIPPVLGRLERAVVLAGEREASDRHTEDAPIATAVAGTTPQPTTPESD